MWPSNHFSREGHEANVTGWAERELNVLEQLVLTHNKMARQEVPVLVVSCTPIRGGLHLRSSIPRTSSMHAASPAGSSRLPAPRCPCRHTDAQLLWNSSGFAQRLKRFAPCVGDVEAEFTPVLGVDVYPENMLKTTGTIAEYASRPRAPLCRVPPPPAMAPLFNPPARTRRLLPTGFSVLAGTAGPSLPRPTASTPPRSSALTSPTSSTRGSDRTRSNALPRPRPIFFSWPGRTRGCSRTQGQR